MKEHPIPTMNVRLHEMSLKIPSISLMLTYSMGKALDMAFEGGLDYDSNSDLVTYYLKVLPEDRELVPYLSDVDEIWIFADGSSSADAQTVKSIQES